MRYQRPVFSGCIVSSGSHFDTKIWSCASAFRFNEEELYFLKYNRNFLHIYVCRLYDKFNDRILFENQITIAI